MTTDLEVFEEYRVRLEKLGWRLTEFSYDRDGITYYTYVADHLEQGTVEHSFCLPHQELRMLMTEKLQKDTLEKSQRLTLNMICEMIES